MKLAQLMEVNLGATAPLYEPEMTAALANTQIEAL